MGDTMTDTRAAVEKPQGLSDFKVVVDAPKPPEFNVLVWNADDVAFEGVLLVLANVFRLTTDAAVLIADTAHRQGKAVVATYATKDLADTQVQLAMRFAVTIGWPSLRFTSEPKT